MTTVFVPMCADILHPGHVNIIKTACELGEVTIGLATDEVIARHKQQAFMTYENRKTVVESLRGVARVIPLPTLDLVNSLRELKPAYLVHGDDWKTGRLQEIRRRAAEVLTEWGGQLVETPYTKGISSTSLRAAFKSIASTPGGHQHRFRRMLDEESFMRVIAVHNSLSAQIAESARFQRNGQTREFDALWLSRPGSVFGEGSLKAWESEQEAHFHKLSEILAVTTKPLLFDWGSTPDKPAAPWSFSHLEQKGISALVLTEWSSSGYLPLPGMEDQIQTEVDGIAQKIYELQQQKSSEDFVIIAGINVSFCDQLDGLAHSQVYIDSGADGILIHGGEDGVSAFSKEYAIRSNNTPLLFLHTGACAIQEDQLQELGIRVIIYGDQLFRSAVASMQKTAETILRRETTW